VVASGLRVRVQSSGLLCEDRVLDGPASGEKGSKRSVHLRRLRWSAPGQGSGFALRVMDPCSGFGLRVLGNGSGFGLMNLRTLGAFAPSVAERNGSGRRVRVESSTEVTLSPPVD